MAKESKDEEYLDSLLNSVINEEDSNHTEDFDEWFEKELSNMEDINFDDSENNIEEINIQENKKSEKNIEKHIEENIKNNEQIEEPEHKQDLNNIEVSDVADDDELEDLMKLIDSYEEKENPVPTITDSVPEEKNVETFIENFSQQETDNLDENKDKEKKKKVSFFKKIFSKKKKVSSEDLNTIDANEILDETGSAFDDMKELALDDVGIEANTNSLFADMENPEDIPEIDSNEKKKKEKKKKEKKQKTPKEKKVRIKKEKKREPDEYIYISPLFMILSLSSIILVILTTYFGASIFSYNNKIDKATSYYVNKEYDKAYEMLSGMNLKDNDKDFYKQVENIMRVEKHINDFNSYMKLDMYVYALESLVKGIASYDDNVSKAGELGTYDILVEESNEIDTLLKTYFNMSVEDARAISRLDSNLEFSNVINEKAANINISAVEGTQGK